MLKRGLTMRRISLISFTFFAVLLVLLLNRAFFVAVSGEMRRVDEKLAAERAQTALSLIQYRAGSSNYDLVSFFTVTKDMAQMMDVENDASVFVINRLNVVCVTDNSGRIIYHQSYDFATGQALELPESHGRYFDDTLNAAHGKASLERSVTEGYMKLDGQLYYVYTKALFYGQSKTGTYLCARKINIDTLNAQLDINGRTKAKILDADSLGNGKRQRLDQAGQLSETVGKEWVVGTVRMDAYDGEPLALEIDFPAESAQDKVHFPVYILQTLLLTGIVVLIHSFVYEQIVIRPAGKVIRQISGMDPDGPETAITLKCGSREILKLRDVMNSLLNDIQARKKKLDESVLSLQKYRHAVMSSVDGIILFDRDGKVNCANSSAVSGTMFSQRNVVGKSIYEDIFDQVSSEQIGEMKENLHRAQSYYGEFEMVGKGGVRSFYDVSITPIMDKDGRLLAGTMIIRNIDEKKKNEQRLWHMAMHDTLTGLSNRLMFNAVIAEELRHAQQTDTLTALFFIDLELYKEVNDAYGHTTGDLLLKLVGDRLSGIENTKCVARMGGDEFTLIISDLTCPQTAREYAQKMVTMLAQPFHIDDYEIRIAASVGVALCPADSETVDGLLKAADSAMYAVKERGGNGYLMYSDLMMTNFI